MATPRPRPQPQPLPYKATRLARPPQPPPLPRSLQPKRIDQSSSTYKKAARKYVGFMVSMPILLVTSYVLFDRLVMGTPTKTLRPEPRPEVEGEKQEGLK